LFVERGYDATTMDDVCVETGLAKGTLYHYFSSKTELRAALRDNFCNMILNRVKSRISLCESDDFFTRIDLLVETAVESYLDTPELRDVIFFSGDTPLRSVAVNDGLVGYISDLLSQGTLEGAWCVDDPHALSTLIYYSIHAIADDALMSGARRPRSAVRVSKLVAITPD
jgi:AcrR family transcriptional regulator|tara:strand:+ start:15592 stop:16101 length:510 start_codon:yes stop_codon:yes gene_type:complete